VFRIVFGYCIDKTFVDAVRLLSVGICLMVTMNICRQLRSLYGRHVSTSFLDPVLGHDEAGLSPNTKSLAAKCLVGVRLGLLNS